MRTADQTHTPGPWAVCKTTLSGQGRILGVTIDGGKTGFPISPISTATPRDYADAHLIAAAPDLLAACNDCIENRGDWAAKMHDAITKATAT